MEPEVKALYFCFPGSPTVAAAAKGVMPVSTATSKVRELLGAEADALLSYQAKGFDKSSIHLPGPDFIDRVVSQTDRNARCCATSS